MSKLSLLLIISSSKDSNCLLIGSGFEERALLGIDCDQKKL